MDYREDSGKRIKSKEKKLFKNILKEKTRNKTNWQHNWRLAVTETTSSH